jgi:hypothetical protein
MTNISVDLLHEYDPGKPGITIPVELKSGQLLSDTTNT